MIKLKEVTINKYTCIESPQTFAVDEKVTVLVGMNESGKTSVLKALAKTNYFKKDDDFRFSVTHDYPRKEKKQLDRSGDDPVAVKCLYSISEDIIKSINDDLGANLFSTNEFEHSIRYSNKGIYGKISVTVSDFWDAFIKRESITDKDVILKLKSIKSSKELEKISSDLSDDLKEKLNNFEKFFENEWKWDNDPISEYVARVHIKEKKPKFLYYDEYYVLPSEISIQKLNTTKKLSDELKTAKALFELADINSDDLISADSFEDYKAELEATQASISDTLFQYWKSNSNIEITFDVEKVITPNHNNPPHPIVEHLLHIRVRNKRTAVTLPLQNRSKGFNWFFSFLVWFKKIQEDKTSNYILLLDEPGLNLHAAAQKDLLKFIEDLAGEYQTIYTTHSPFMVESSKISRVRTVHETINGSIISDSIQEKDPNTLFPLQAALGYSIAQNLFISKNNLLVEGVSDLIYLNFFSLILQTANRTGLNDNITIVPVGGLDKVATFVSLLRGNELNLVCLLDSFNDPSSKARLENLIKEKIIKQKNVKFFDEFTEKEKADIEDMFEKN
jgi:predicted ATPase